MSRMDLLQIGSAAATARPEILPLEQIGRELIARHRVRTGVGKATVLDVSLVVGYAHHRAQYSRDAGD